MKYILPFLLLADLIFAQILSSSLNKEKIELGETITLKINIQDLQGKNVISAQKNGLLPFYLEENKDEITQTSQQYTRTIDFSIFDEGKFTIPALEFKVGDSIHRTIPYEIEVTNPTQKNEEINDIMPNQEVKLTLADYWTIYQNYIFIFLGVLGLITGFIFFKKHRKENKNSTQNSLENILKSLEQLQNKNYIEKNEYRSFYIELLEIIREFLVKKYKIPADILLTDDLIDLINKSNFISTEKQGVLKEIFTRGDLAKFAKTIPEQSLMEKDFSYIQKWIESSCDA